MAVGAHKARLGRGLASLIGGPLDEAALAAEGEQRILPLGAIKPGRFNPRRNFAPGPARTTRPRMDSISCWSRSQKRISIHSCKTS